MAEYHSDDEDHRDDYERRYGGMQYDTRSFDTLPETDLTRYIAQLGPTDVFALAAQDFVTSQEICYFDEMDQAARLALVDRYRSLSNMRRCLGDQLKRQEDRERKYERQREEREREDRKKAEDHLAVLTADQSTSVVVDFEGFARPDKKLLRHIISVSDDRQRIRLSNPYNDQELWFYLDGLYCHNVCGLPDQRINLKKTAKVRQRMQSQ